MFKPFRYAVPRRGACIGVLAVVALAWLTQAHESPQVVLLVDKSASIYQRAALGFEQGFGEADKISKILLDPDDKAFAPVMADVSKEPPRLVVAIGTKIAVAAHTKLSGYPIIYCLVFDPVHNDLVGSNIGGFTFQIDISQQMEELQRALPSAKRIGVIYDEPVSGRLVRKAKQYLHSDVRLIARDAQNPRKAREAIDSLAGAIDAFWLLWDPVIANPANFRHLVDVCFRNRIALVSPATPFVEAGALMSISPNYYETGRKAGLFARDVLNGKMRVGDIGGQPPVGPVLTVNGEVARHLGFVIPADLEAEILAPQ